MQSHISQLTKQRLSDFFVKEDGHVAHKNALVAGTVMTGTILASILLTPDVAAELKKCGDDGNFTFCDDEKEYCCSDFHGNGDVFYYCADKRDGC